MYPLHQRLAVVHEFGVYLGRRALAGGCLIVLLDAFQRQGVFRTFVFTWLCPLLFGLPISLFVPWPLEWYTEGRVQIQLMCYSMLRNSASGPEIGLPGRILAGLLPGKNRNLPSGRPSAGRRSDLGAFPEAGRPTSGPEG